jgi:hypothetical protein
LAIGKQQALDIEAGISDEQSGSGCFSLLRSVSLLHARQAITECSWNKVPVGLGIHIAAYAESRSLRVLFSLSPACRICFSLANGGLLEENRLQYHPNECSCSLTFTRAFSQ